MLAEERKSADGRLTRQLEHSAAQLQAQRDLAREHEQLDQADAAVVVLGGKAAGPVFGDVGDADVRTLVLMITNNGKYTITRVEAQFSPDGRASSRTTRHPDRQPRQSPGQAARRPARPDRGRPRQRPNSPGRRHAL